MGSFNRNDRGGRRSFDRGGFGGNRFDRGGTRGGARQMFRAVCSNCGKDCEVPFQPTSSKPVYCSDCFEKMGNGGRDGRRDDRRSDGGGNRRFEDRRSGGDNKPDQNKALLESINLKLEKIMKLLETAGNNKPTETVVKPSVQKVNTKPEVMKGNLPEVHTFDKVKKTSKKTESKKTASA